MVSFLQDLAGAIYDFIKLIMVSLGYFLAGILLVAIPIYLFVWGAKWLLH